MTHKIIYTEDYALIVSDEQAKENDWGYIPFQGGEIKLVAKFFADDWKKVIAHLPLKDAPIFKGLPLLPSFSCGQQDDVAEWASKTYPFSNSRRNALITGYNKAKETYKYTEGDLSTAIVLYLENKSFREIIESFQQPKRPDEFEIHTTPMDLDEIREQGKGFLNANTDKPKTTTNAQGQTELIGHYIYG